MNTLIDELPLWSAPFGLSLLKTIRIKKQIDILDIGSGSGFPMIELAERFGIACKVYGIDPDESSRDLFLSKLASKGITNAKLITGTAEELPFTDGQFGLIVSNNGLNNVKDEKKVLQECFRVASPGAQMALTMNLPGTMREFYMVLEKILLAMDLKDEIRKVKEHIESKRKTIDTWIKLITFSGFCVSSTHQDEFLMKFTDGSSFLNHSLIRNAFRPSWEELLPAEKIKEIFLVIEKELNHIADEEGHVTVSVPNVCFDCIK